MSQQCKVAIVGYGGMGGHHADHLLELEAFDVAGIRDIRDSQQDLARNKGLHVYPSLEDVLGDETVDVVLIATPNHIHKEIAVKAMRAGKDVICEKPATMNSREMEEMIEVEKETGRLFVVNQNRRWDEDYLVVKKLHDEQAIGEIFNVECRVHGSRGIPGDWRQQKEFGGGMLLDWGVHLVDRVLLMFNEKVSHVYCKLNHVRNNEVDDGFKMTLTFESGRTAFLEVGTYNYINLPLWYVNGTQGSAVIHDWSMKGEVVHLETDEQKDAVPITAGAGLTKTMAPRRDDGTVRHLPLPRVDSHINEFYFNVKESIEGTADILVGNEEVLQVMRLLEAAFESDASGQVIAIENKVGV
ncbi:Gfo/Idh/MocA family oxidoreductase [Salipaludibacillus sp. CUR1]|uniref:Gfo/Idh/MocA family protein n=1 Tax=Salipaludibacillus sp. CUR1 TaxID=2820003 RepID=UPI001E59D276|nr:Gfo/Idh/MocA family oxidoreductase [Salipaludibacillus sp. CUR1]MCE7793943.1 Gfo/Idh/MocA family oxidoreductase [Salipaludibacillus sp. CUR1]